MPYPSHIQVTALGVPIPNWQAVFVLAHLSHGRDFPDVDSQTTAATRAAITARGIQLPLGGFDGLLKIYLNLSRAEQVALHLMNADNIGPKQNMASGSVDEGLLQTQLMPLSTLADLSNALQGAGEFVFDEQGFAASTTVDDTIPLIPKMSDVPKAQPSFDDDLADSYVDVPGPASFNRFSFTPEESLIFNANASMEESTFFQPGPMFSPISKPSAQPPLGLSDPLATTRNPRPKRPHSPHGVHPTISTTDTTTSMRSSGPGRGTSTLSLIAEHNINLEQAEADIDESVRIISEGIAAAMEVQRDRQSSSDAVLQPRRNHESIYGCPRMSLEDNIGRSFACGVNKVRSGLAKHRKLRWFISDQATKVSEKAKAGYEAYTRRHDLHTLDGEIVEWNYVEIPDHDEGGDWKVADGEWMVVAKPLSEKEQWKAWDKEYPGLGYWDAL